MALKPVSVTQLNQYIKRILQTDALLGNVTVKGEISNLKFHSSGHVYFSLKDQQSRINCFLPEDKVDQLHFEMAEGMAVCAVGYIYLYEKGGSYSLNVKLLEPEGEGDLSIAFRKLKEKLEKEGLFSEKHKQEIPSFARNVAVVTSPTGAAVRDIIKIIRSRSDMTDIRVFPCLVQGTEAAKSISRAIETVNRTFPDADVIILGRGGGSMEELWAFNEEIVARSIFASQIPVISAVGHETDFTISDFTADRRAATPSEAAQMAVPDVFRLRREVKDAELSLEEIFRKKLRFLRLQMEQSDPSALTLYMRQRLRQEKLRVEGLIQEIRLRGSGQIAAFSAAVDRQGAVLEGYSPYGVMEKGYGIVLNEEGNQKSLAGDFRSGDSLTVMLKDGNLKCTVNAIEERRQN